MNENVEKIFEKVKTTGAAAAGYVGKTATAAGKKTSEVWNVTRLRMQIYDLQNELNGIYRQMGELLYAAHVDVDASTGEIDVLLEKAESKINEINTRRHKIAEAKSAGKCSNPDCKKSIGKNDTYCRFCGTAVKAGEEE